MFCREIADEHTNRSRFAPSAEHRGARPSYAVRRFGATVVAIVIMSLLLAAVHAVAGSFGGVPAVAAEAPLPASSADDPPAPRVHIARSGDSLWSIAERHRGTVDRDRYIAALIDLNGSTTVLVGQAVVLPTAGR